jgi:hypothetical protein
MSGYYYSDGPGGGEVPPDLAPGFRYNQAAVMEAAEVIERGAGPYYNYTDDPRNIVQDVLDIFIGHGSLVAMDLGYEATIIDLRARLASAELAAAAVRRADPKAPRPCRVPGCSCDGLWYLP